MLRLYLLFVLDQLWIVTFLAAYWHARYRILLFLRLDGYALEEKFEVMTGNVYFRGILGKMGAELLLLLLFSWMVLSASFR